MNDFVLILKNLFRKKLRALLMIISILVAFAIFGTLASFEWAFNAREDSAKTDRLIVVNKINMSQQLPVSYFNRVAAIDGVGQATHANWFGGYYQDPKNFLVVFAVDPESYMKLYDSDLIFKPEAREAFIRERAGALVGQRMMAKWGWKVGDLIPLSSNIYSKKDGSHVWDVKIVGTFGGRTAQNDSNVMLVQYDYFDESRSFQKDLIGWIALRTASPGIADKVAKTIDATFANSPDETTTDTEKAFTRAFSAQIRQYRADGWPGGGSGLRHDPDDRRQHHGADHPRAHARDRGPEDARLLRRAYLAHGPWRIGAARPDRRRAGACARRRSDLRRSRQRDAVRADPDDAARRRSRSARPHAGARRLDRTISGAERHAAENRRRPRKDLTKMRSLFLQIAAVTTINLKSLQQRLWLSLSTVVAIALVVIVLLSFAMANGFRRTIEGSGADDVAVVLRGGSQSEINSVVSRDQAQLIEEGAGIAQRFRGQAVGLSRALSHGRRRQAGDRHKGEPAPARHRR